MLICPESLHPINIKIHTCILALRLRMAARRVCFQLITATAHREARGIIACAICSNRQDGHLAEEPPHQRAAPERAGPTHVALHANFTRVQPTRGQESNNKRGVAFRSARRLPSRCHHSHGHRGSILRTKLPLSGASSHGNQ